MGNGQMSQAKEHLAQGLRCQQELAYSQAKFHYLSAAELMLRAAMSASGALRANCLAQAKDLRQIATHLDSVAAPEPPVTQASQTGAEAASANQTPWLVVERPSVRFDDVAGFDAVKQEISLTALYPFTHPQLASYYHIQGGGGILLYGPPGVGKTLFARAIAGELELPFFWVKSSDILSKYVGEAEQNVARLFAAARQYPRAVLLFDEVEKLTPARSETNSSVMPRVVGQMLEEINGFADHPGKLLLIGNTNVPWLIDDAFFNPRRFGTRIYIPLPDLPARQAILRMNLEHTPLQQELPWRALAQRLEGYSGADVTQLCYRARAIPFLEAVHTGKARPLTGADIEQAITQVAPSVSRKSLRRFEDYAQQRAPD